MGFYLRKSVSVGPFRFNLSGSGIGMSAGIPGFRVGTGPRGNYVRIGRGGIYYQQTFPSPASPRIPVRRPDAAPRMPELTHAPLESIESAGAAQIVDSSSEQILNEIREKDRLWSLTPLAIVAAIAICLFALSTGSDGFELFALICGVALIIFTKQRDIVRKTVVVMYDLEPGVEQAFQRFQDCAQEISSTQRAWHVAASGQVFDRKYHAGASALVQRNPTPMRTAAPPRMRTNVPVLSIGAGKQTLYFLPDRLLIYDGAGVGAVSYRSLEISVTRQQFIETSGVPSDATVVDHTWRYVNRKGGPDRRFNHNPRIPICMYDELHFRTASGLNEVVQISRSGVAEGFEAAVRQLGSVVA